MFNFRKKRKSVNYKKHVRKMDAINEDINKQNKMADIVLEIAMSIAATILWDSLNLLQLVMLDGERYLSIALHYGATYGFGNKMVQINLLPDGRLVSVTLENEVIVAKVTDLHVTSKDILERGDYFPNVYYLLVGLLQLAPRLGILPSQVNTWVRRYSDICMIK